MRKTHGNKEKTAIVTGGWHAYDHSTYFTMKLIPGGEKLRSLTWLTRADVETVSLPMSEIIQCVELALTEKALKRTQMPPKHWMESTPVRWFGAMSSIVPAVNAAAVKWQSGSSENAKAGLPYITGMLILNDLESGLPIAIMDSTWITAMRTAAETAVAAKYLANPAPKVLSIVGCGVQGRTNAEALKIVRPSLEEICCYDIDSAAMERYAGEMTQRFGYKVTMVNDPRSAIEAGDIVVTGGPIEPGQVRVVTQGWLKQGALAVPLDYDCYWTAAAFADAELLLTDDIGQLEHLAAYGYFLNVPAVAGELGDVIAGLIPGRKNEKDRIISINMGVSVEDVTTAKRIYELASKRGIGQTLSM